MPGSNSSARDAGPDSLPPISMTVHSMPAPTLDDAQRRTKSGRMRMLLVLAVCAAPVIASYVAYFVIRPEGRTNYSTLIEPLRPMPRELPLIDLRGQKVDTASLKGNWMLVVVGGGACDAACERHLWLQRQLREALGRDKDRLDKLWLIDDAAVPRAQTLQAIDTGASMQVLRVDPAALADWLTPASGHGLAQHLFLIDPLGNWMMRVPPDPDPSRLKRDVERLMRASAGWHQPRPR
jgi:hypothetical protein